MELGFGYNFGEEQCSIYLYKYIVLLVRENQEVTILCIVQCVARMLSSQPSYSLILVLGLSPACYHLIFGAQVPSSFGGRRPAECHKLLTRSEHGRTVTSHIFWGKRSKVELLY